MNQHLHLPRGEAFRFTPFIQCDGMGYAWVTEDGDCGTHAQDKINKKISVKL